MLPVPKSSGENAIGMLVDGTKGEAFLKGALVGCASGARSALGLVSDEPYARLKAGKCNFIFAHQKHVVTLRKVLLAQDAITYMQVAVISCF
jgi:hypothetical protein